MNGSHNPNSNQRPSTGQTPAKWIVVGCILIGIIAAVLAFKFLTPTHEPRQKPTTVAAAPEPKVVPSEPAPLAPVVAHNPKPTPPTQPQPPQPTAIAAPRTPQDLVKELADICSSPGPITKEQAEKFKQNLEELVRRGAASVPAIREMLAKNVDYDFAEDVEGGDQLVYSSLRAALIDTLKQIGGPEAQSAMVATLQTSALPAELLEVAKNLDLDAPGAYRAEILKAARDSLQMAAANQLGTNIETGPAYRILQNYGEANTTADLAKNDPANFYNALSLANLPDGQGLPSLVQMAQSSGSDSFGQVIATEMIGQLAGQNAQALDTLVQMAQSGQIRNSTWEKLAPILAGDQYQISASTADQSLNSASTPYTVVSSVTTPDQINQRVALIDRFLGIVPSDSAAAASLQHQRGILVTRLGL
jgi:hypothetical protein